MTTIRDALDTYPLAHLLRPGRRGQMDLRPSLAMWIAQAVNDVPTREEPAGVPEIMSAVQRVADSWNTTASQLPGTERAVVMAECAVELERALDELMGVNE